MVTRSACSNDGEPTDDTVITKLQKIANRSR
jgi:hypothetical protein